MEAELGSELEAAFETDKGTELEMEAGTETVSEPETKPKKKTPSYEELNASVKEALSVAMAIGKTKKHSADAETKEKNTVEPKHEPRHKKKKLKASNVAADEEFYWYNIQDVKEKPDYKSADMYYHYFNFPDESIDELLMEMYDSALVRTEDIRYIAYGIEPVAVSLKDIMSEKPNEYNSRTKKKLPNANDKALIYDRWCSYVDELFDIIEVHADDLTIEAIRNKLYEFGLNSPDEIIEGR
jgi:hypothetical protein